MDPPMGASSKGDFRLDFDRRVRLEFYGSKISSDGGLLLFRERDETLGLHDLAWRSLRDTRRGKNGVHNFTGPLRQSTFGRRAGYRDVNDADRLARDPVMRQFVGGRAALGHAASTSQMTRFETDILASTYNRAALADLPGQWIDTMHEAQPPKWISLDMDSSVRPRLLSNPYRHPRAQAPAEACMTGSSAKPRGKRFLHCVLNTFRWVKTHQKLENRACRTVNIDDLGTDTAVTVENAYENAQARARQHHLGNIGSMSQSLNGSDSLSESRGDHGHELRAC